ncbi:MAG: lysoplasmalogenase [Sinobacteraceae bacterium]|nr:lysoplasmalogenase [Nevskiaceae bacterium]
MITALYVAAAISALLAIGADWEERRRRAFYLLKPLTSALILAAAAWAPDTAGRVWIVAALALSLVGDVCLMFAGERWFAAGLGSFLVAHLLLIRAFLLGVPLAWPPAWTLALVAYGAALAAWLLPRAGKLKRPVALYCLVLLAMALAAALRFHAQGGRAAGLALAGALLFVVSDSALALRQFGGPYRGAQALILSTYWLAIGLIAASVSANP